MYPQLSPTIQNNKRFAQKTLDLLYILLPLRLLVPQTGSAPFLMQCRGTSIIFAFPTLAHALRVWSIGLFSTGASIVGGTGIVSYNHIALALPLLRWSFYSFSLCLSISVIVPSRFEVSFGRLLGCFRAPLQCWLDTLHKVTICFL